MELLSDKVLAVIPTDDPSPVAFMNLYEPGDMWVKVHGCEGCNEEQRRRCCGQCVLYVNNKGCERHLERGTMQSKPFHCTVLPVPNQQWGNCHLVYECIAGKWKGYQRQIWDEDDVAIDPDGNIRSIKV